MNLAQVIAAVAAGALLTVATMLAFRLYRLQSRAAREQRVRDAVRLTIEAAETFRLHRAPPSPPDAAHTDAAPRARLHLVGSQACGHRVHPVRTFRADASAAAEHTAGVPSQSPY